MQGLVEFNATLIIQIINTLILFAALRYILFKPVTNFMDKRVENIQSSVEEAETGIEEANELKAEYEKQLRDIRSERNEIIEEAIKATEVKSNEMIAEAREDAAEMLEKARAQIESDKQRMMNELRGEVSSLAIAVASKVVEKNLDEASHKDMIEHFIDEVGDIKWKN